MKFSSLLVALAICLTSITSAEAGPRKKKSDYDYITVTVLSQWSVDMAYAKLKQRGDKVGSNSEKPQSMTSVTFEGDESASELYRRFFEQYTDGQSLPLALDYLGDYGWEVTTSNQVYVDSGLLMTTVILRKPK